MRRARINADGTPAWRHDTPIPPTSYYRFIDAGVDPRGVPYFAVMFWYDVGQLVVRLDPATGDVLTSTVVAPPAGYDSLSGAAITADSEGNLFSASSGRITGTGADAFIAAKIDTAGAVAWYGQWFPSYYSWDPRIGVDRQGDVVLTGDAWYGFSTGWDPIAATIKFDGQSGAALWTASYYGLPNRSRQGVYFDKLGFDRDDGVYLAGSQTTADSQWPTIIKYDRNGAFQWEAVETSGHGGWGSSLVTDAAGAAYVATGVDDSSAGTGTDCVVAKYLPDGTKRWFRQYDGLESGDDAGCLLAADGLGGVYLAFTSQYVGRAGVDATVLKLDSATGDIVWRILSGSPLLTRPAFGPGLMASTPTGTLAVYGKPGTDLGVLQIGPNPSAATLVAPTPVPRLAASGTGSTVVNVTVTATRPEVVCNLTGGGTPFDSLHAQAGAAGTFLYRPEVSPTGYSATCYYDGPAGVGTVNVTLQLQCELGSGMRPLVLTFDGSATHQASSASLDASLSALNPAIGNRLWVFDGVDSVDPDSGKITAYLWEVRDTAR